MKKSSRFYLKYNPDNRWSFWTGKWWSLCSEISGQFTPKLGGQFDRLFHIFGDNQVIEQSSFSFGFFILAIDFFLYDLRKKELKKNIPFADLSARENEILKILLDNPDLKYAQISEQLNISEKTLSAHLNKIYKKIGIKSKKEINELSKSIRESIMS